MKFEEFEVNCRELTDYKLSKRTTPFTVAYATFNYVSDVNHKSFIDKIISDGTELAKKVNPAAASNANFVREKRTLINNAAAGILAEYCWKEYTNQKAGRSVVDSTIFTGASAQIDLINLNNQKLIEVRSSFPRNGIGFAICHPTYEFDILGPYTNKVKPGEILKHFYVRTLFHIPKGTTFLERVKTDGFKVLLTGGSTWEMMTDNSISKNKTLRPQDAVSVAEDEESEYRVVPFSKALDTIEIFNLINQA